MEDIRGSGGTPGIGFSPIPAEKTMEDLPALLARLFGGAGLGTGVSKLPGLSVRGVPPDEILRAFLASLPGGGGGPAQRPDITQVLAPEQPPIAQQPSLPIAPPRTAPSIIPEPAAPLQAEAPGGAPGMADIFPAGPGPSGPGPSGPAPSSPGTPPPTLSAPVGGGDFSDIISGVLESPTSSTESPSPGEHPEIPTAPGPDEGPTRGAPTSELSEAEREKLLEELGMGYAS